MKTFEVWAEGYRADDSIGYHRLIGTQHTETFKEACIALLGFSKWFNPEKLTYLSCRLFDNASKAAEVFG